MLSPFAFHTGSFNWPTVTRLLLFSQHGQLFEVVALCLSLIPVIIIYRGENFDEAQGVTMRL